MVTTRLFYTVDAPEVNEEIFLTQSAAESEFKRIAASHAGTRLYIAEVTHAYYDEDAGGWNYDDHADTFNVVKVLKRQ